jgi:hypothetical protein
LDILSTNKQSAYSISFHNRKGGQVEILPSGTHKKTKKQGTVCKKWLGLQQSLANPHNEMEAIYTPARGHSPIKEIMPKILKLHILYSK